MCWPVCGKVHIKDPLLLIGRSGLCGDSGFLLRKYVTMAICLKFISQWYKNWCALAVSGNKTNFPFIYMYGASYFIMRIISIVIPPSCNRPQRSMSFCLFPHTAPPTVACHTTQPTAQAILLAAENSYIRDPLSGDRKPGAASSCILPRDSIQHWDLTSSARGQKGSSDVMDASVLVIWGYSVTGGAKMSLHDWWFPHAVVPRPPFNKPTPLLRVKKEKTEKGDSVLSLKIYRQKAWVY